MMSGEKSSQKQSLKINEIMFRRMKGIQKNVCSEGRGI